MQGKKKDILCKVYIVGNSYNIPYTFNKDRLKKRSLELPFKGNFSSELQKPWLKA